jgi:5'(3')-deoxyribonucleotidase
VFNVAQNEFDNVHGIFRYAEPMSGAIEAVKELSKHFDLYIATAAPWKNPESAGDKLCWLQHHFGGLFAKKVAITHCKHMLIGDYLIDDRLVNGAAEFQGQHIHFGTLTFPDWSSVLKHLLPST